MTAFSNALSNLSSTLLSERMFDRVMESAKPAIAIVIIYAIAFHEGWDKPYWAAVSAASVNLLSQGMTLYRGVIRVAATIVGGFTALAIIALFPQERWAYQAAAVIPILLFGYGCSGKHDYFYVVCGITFMVVLAVAWTIEDWSSGDAHQIVMLRVTQTWMGSLVMVLINVFVWPKTSIGDLNKVARAGWANQQHLFAATRGMLFGEDRAEDAKRLRLKDIELQEQSHFLLHIAENDSFEMLEFGHDWHEFLHESAAQVEGIGSLRESSAEVQGLDLTTYLPNLDAFCSELEQRFEQTKRMLAKKAPTRMPQSISLTANEAEIEALSHFQQAAVAVVRAQLENINAINRSLFHCVAKIRRFEKPDAEHGAHGAHDAHSSHDAHGSHGAQGHWLSLDPDRTLSAVANAVTIWVAFLCWIYIWDVPNGPLFWAMTGIFTFIMGYRGEVTWKEYLWSWGVGTAVAGICYVFIMQHLHGYRELGALIFISCFLMFFVLFPKPHPVGRMFALISYTIVLSAENHQHYKLEHFIHYALWLFLVIVLSLAVRFWFFPSRPEKNFLRFFDRFFVHAHLLISAHGPEGVRRQGLFERLKMVFFRDDLTESPRKMALYASEMDAKMLLPGRGTIDYKMLGTPAEQVQDLVMSVYLLAYRVKDLVEARELPRMELLENKLANEKHEWRQLIEEWFQRRVSDPEQAIELATDLPERLAKLEPRIDEAFEQVDTKELSDEDRENFYRLLSSYRGLSEAVINHARVADAFDWPRWRETRF